MTLPPARPPTHPDPGREEASEGVGPPPSGRPIPVPVRTLREPEPRAAESDADATQVSVVYEDGASTWRVTVVGEVAGRSFPRGAALLFLRFEDETGGERLPREGWTMGPLPGALEPARLAAALEQSRPWSEGRPKEGFFDEMDGRRGR